MDGIFFFGVCQTRVLWCSGPLGPWHAQVVTFTFWGRSSSATQPGPYRFSGGFSWLADLFKATSVDGNAWSWWQRVQFIQRVRWQLCGSAANDAGAEYHMFCTPRASPRSDFTFGIELFFSVLVDCGRGASSAAAGGALCALALVHFVLWLVGWLRGLGTTLCDVCTVVAGVVLWLCFPWCLSLGTVTFSGWALSPTWPLKLFQANFPF